MLIIFKTVCAQISEKNNLIYKEKSYDVVIFKIDTNSITKFKILENKQLLPEKTLFDSLSKQSKYFASNASIIDTSCNFLGLYISQSIKKHDINLNSGQGNFFLKPNGFIGFNDTDIIIKSSDEYNNKDHFNLAIQSGPLLVLNNSINQNFSKSSKNIFNRIGVGTYFEKNAKYLVFVISRSPVTFYEFSTFFKDYYKCDYALNIESGPIVFMHSPSAINKLNKNKISCSYLYYPIEKK